MSDVWAKDFKILVLDLPNLETDMLGKVVIHCSDNNDLQKALAKYRSSTIFIACYADKLIGLDLLLKDYSIQTLYVIDNVKDDTREWLDSLIFTHIIEVENETKLLRHLCATTMLCYYNQSLKYRNDGNMGMTNLCLLDSLKALDFTSNFI